LTRPLPRRVPALLFFVLLAGCSRSPSGDAPQPDAEARGSASAPRAAPTPSEAAPAPVAGPILTPEDVEQETEQRITEQNLESELDRLEREIQAE